jgi:antirestriction protein ArdC
MPAETPQARAQRRARDRALVVSAVERLRTSDGWRAWLRARSRFRRYSLHNQLLIALQRPSATRVAGAATWRGLGYGVRRAEAGIRIWAPSPPSRERMERWQRGGGEPRDRPRTRFRLAVVYAQDQIEALPPPAVPAPLVPPIAPIEGATFAHALAPLVALGATIGYDVVFDHVPHADGTCSVRTRQIAVSAALAPNAQVAALIHELAHALVAAEHGGIALRYAQEEVVVESVAWSVCGALGLDTSANSIPYLAAWSQDLDLAILEQTAQTIDRLASRIEAAVLVE